MFTFTADQVKFMTDQFEMVKDINTDHLKQSMSDEDKADLQDQNDEIDKILTELRKYD